MKWYTSYYANKNIPKDAFKIQVSNSKPNWFEVDLRWNNVVPYWKYIVDPHKNGKITDERYEELYRIQLNNNKTYIGIEIERWNKYFNQDIVLLCYEGKDKFCHRHILANWIKENYNIEVAEL